MNCGKLEVFLVIILLFIFAVIYSHWNYPLYEGMSGQRREEDINSSTYKPNDIFEENNYYLNSGIPKSQIPKGKEDLYILKSEIVPPVCPACPSNSNCPREKPCQPCPPCARCPEPAFECKKVPNYSSSATVDYLPRPILNDFSQF